MRGRRPAPRLQGPNRHALLVGVERYPGFGDSVTLRGCRNDVALVASVLRERFGFDDGPHAGRFDVLLDEEATRDAVVAALGRLLQAIAPGDVAVVYFSGHGSQVTDLEGDEGDGLDETLVPFDGTRRGPHREITDDEIHAWLAVAAARTHFVTTIFDCCHAGSLRRHRGPMRIRRVAPDRRSAAALRRPPHPPWARRMRTSRADGKIAPVPDHVHLAACRDDELAGELMASQTGCGVHGAFTFHLCRALLDARGDATWRDVIERVRGTIVAHHAAQTPQLEGARDRLLFGVGDLPPRKHVLVIARREPTRAESAGESPRVELAAGAALGLTAGSLWRLTAPGSRDASTPVGRLRLDTVGAARAAGPLLEERSAGLVAPGCRAFEEAHHHGDPVLTVGVARRGVTRRELPASSLRALERSLDAAPLLRRVTLDEAEVQVWALGRRGGAAADDPVPQLGALGEPVWALVDAGGRLLETPRRVVGDTVAQRLGVIPRLVTRLVRQARWRRALALENPESSSRLRGRVGFELLRCSEDGSWGAWSAGEDPFYDEGGRLAFALENRSAEPVYPYVVDFGFTGGIDLLYPPRGGHELLEPGLALSTGVASTIADRSIRLGFPRDWPRSDDPATGRPTPGPGVLKLFATTTPVDVELLTQPVPWRTRPGELAGTGQSDHPLARLLALDAGLQRLRGVELAEDSARDGGAWADDWTTEIRRYLLVPRDESAR